MAVAEAPSASLFDAAKDRRLAEIYAPCFTLILQLRAAYEFGDPDLLRRRIKDLLDDSEREASRSGARTEDLRESRFALVAFIDETILSSDWSQKDYWVAKPLQLEFSDRFDAGEVFFDKLDKLRENPSRNAEVLEVYYLCMTLGFKGRYQLHDQGQLRILIEKTFDDLGGSRGLGSVMLSPHGKPRGQVASEVESKLPAWVIAVVAGAIGMLIYFGMTLYMNSAGNSTVDLINQVPREEAAP